MAPGLRQPYMRQEAQSRARHSVQPRALNGPIHREQHMSWYHPDDNKYTRYRDILDNHRATSRTRESATSRGQHGPIHRDEHRTDTFRKTSSITRESDIQYNMESNMDENLSLNSSAIETETRLATMHRNIQWRRDSTNPQPGTGNPRQNIGNRDGNRWTWYLTEMSIMKQILSTWNPERLNKICHS